MDTYKTIIIDDERLAREEVKRALENYPEFEIIGESPVNAKTYSFGINFINEEGLYLFNNHKYEKVSDSQFTFDLFKLKKAKT